MRYAWAFRSDQSRWLGLHAFVAVPLLAVLSACFATESPPARGASSPPWLLRHTFPGWDGKPVEVLGAPGPRAVAAFLWLAMQRARVSQPKDLGDVLHELPSFYHFRLMPANSSPSASPVWWQVRSEGLHPDVEWEGNETALFGHRYPEQILERLSLRDLALAISDVVWKWPRLPGSRTFIRPPEPPASVGFYYVRALREKLDCGMPLERAWQELQFQMFDDIYLVSLLADGLVRVSWHPEMDPKDWPPPPPWVGKY